MVISVLYFLGPPVLTFLTATQEAKDLVKAVRPYMHIRSALRTLQTNIALQQKLDEQIQRCTGSSIVDSLVRFHHSEACRLWSSTDRRQYTQLLRGIFDKANGENVPQLDASEQHSFSKEVMLLTPVLLHRGKTMSSLTLLHEWLSTGLG